MGRRKHKNRNLPELYPECYDEDIVILSPTWNSPPPQSRPPPPQCRPTPTPPQSRPPPPQTRPPPLQSRPPPPQSIPPQFRPPPPPQSMPMPPPKSAKRKVAQYQRVFCSVCATELDLKPTINGPPPTIPEMDDNLSVDCKLGISEQISLEALCTLGGQGVEESMSRDCFMDKNTPCQLCTECFGIVEDARELQQNIELLQSELASRTSALKSRIDESSGRFGHRKAGRLPNDLAKLKKIQKVLGRAFGPELLPNPVLQNPAYNIQPCHNNNNNWTTTMLEGQGTSNGRVLIKQEPSFDFNGTRIFTVPGIKSEFGETVTTPQATNSSGINIIEATPSGSCRPKRKYVKREIKYESDQISDDDDYSPVKQPREKKRKYTKRKPLKRELVPDDDSDFGDDVKIESKILPNPAAKGCHALLDSGDGQWLTENIEPASKGVILRSTLYHHYFQHCIQAKRVPPNQATFGKLVKSVFAGFVGCRRLGQRGCSMYCHTGIRIKGNSSLNDVIEQYDVEEGGSRNAAKRHVGSKTKRRGVLKELGIKIPPRAPNPVISTTLFGSVNASGAGLGRLGQQFMPPLPLDLNSSLNLGSESDDQPVDNILRNLMS